MSRSVAALLLGSLVSSAAALVVQDSSQQAALRGQAETFIRSLKFKQTLRVCNAYPDSPGMDVFLGKEKLSKKALQYKMCDDMNTELKPGDVLDFKVDGNIAGTFTISSVPDSDAVLLMVISRHDTYSAAVAFESHVFASTAIAQAAVIDTYKGKTKNDVKITHTPVSKGDKKKEKKVAPRTELLRYDSLVAINEGKYDVKLVDSEEEDKVVSKSALVALAGECYAVLRVGVEAEEGKSFPPELVVYPHSDPHALGGASSLCGVMPLLLATLTALAQLTFA